MKKMYTALLMTLMIFAVSCGNEKKSNGSSYSSFSSDPLSCNRSNVEGYWLLNSANAVESNGMQYRLAHGSNTMAINAELQRAYQVGIQPINLNGMQALRARFVGCIQQSQSNAHTFMAVQNSVIINSLSIY